MIRKSQRNDENKENVGNVTAFFAQMSQASNKSPPPPELPAAIRPQMDPLQGLLADPAVVSVLPLEITILNLTDSLDLSRTRLENQCQIKFNKNAKNIPQNANNIPKKYQPAKITQTLAQNSEHSQRRRNSGSIRLMGPPKCRPKNQNHPYTRPLTPKDPMEEPRKRELLSGLENGDCLSEALKKMMKKSLANEYSEYENKYLALEIHVLWQNEAKQVSPEPQDANPLSCQCVLHHTNSSVFCSGNPDQAAPVLGADSPPGGAQTAAQAEAAAHVELACQSESSAAQADADTQADAARAEVGRGGNHVKEITAPFGSMDYMPEAWRNFTINLDEFYPYSTDPELIQLYMHFV